MRRETVWRDEEIMEVTTFIQMDYIFKTMDRIQLSHTIREHFKEIDRI